MKVPQKDQRFLQEVYSLSLNPKMPTSYEHDSTTLLVRSIGKKGNKKEEQRKSGSSNEDVMTEAYAIYQ